ncbi:MAG: hypothetical protein ABWY06_04000 [Pseudomonas sp.]|uniref:DUF7079 family protein n=1 Tax=Pseudomonas sp. TaxID=306 RepID=UPI00339B793A
MTTLSEYEFARRLPIWAALSELFVAKELQQYDYRAIAAVLQGAGRTVAELEDILCAEVYPVFSSNISAFNTTPEMEPWNAEEVRALMFAYLQRRRGFLAGLAARLRRSPLENPVLKHNWGQVKALL